MDTINTYQVPNRILRPARVSKTLDPVGTHLNGIRLAIFILAEGHMPCATTNGISILENGKVVYRGIMQRLLNIR